VASSKWESDLDDLASDIEGIVDTIGEELQALAPGLVRELEVTHGKETDPYGKPWQRRKGDQPWPINDRTGELKRSYRYRSRDGKVTVSNDAPHAPFVDAKRQIIPDPQHGIPDRWFDLLDKRIDKALKRRFR
jgi:hypothetical protein